MLVTYREGCGCGSCSHLLDSGRMQQFVIHLGRLPDLIAVSKVAFDVLFDAGIELDVTAWLESECRKRLGKIEPQMVADSQAAAIVNVFQKHSLEGGSLPAALGAKALEGAQKCCMFLFP